MFKKSLGLVFLLIFIGGSIGLWGAYRNYSNRQAERRARLAQQAAEVTATVIEGWTTEQIADYFEDLGLFSKKDFLHAVEQFDTAQFPSVNERKNQHSLEGYLFPDTYRFAKNATPQEVITKMLTNFSTRVENLGSPRAGSQPAGLPLPDLITLASIIEKESGGKGSTTGDMSLQDERNLVAGVFYNRLKIGQALESDATINYITGKDSPGASSTDIAVNSPYNTYKYPGLPPGPICNPSLGSIKAAFAPADTDFLYFLHQQPSGKVDFSRTFEEHKRKKQ